jgi:peptide/nickel transport system permease protein
MATLVVLVGMMYFNWSPRLQWVSPFENLPGNLVMYVWPAITVGWATQAIKARMTRSTTLEVLRQDYIRTAHAKGLSNFVVVYRHAIKNALLPVVTIIGISISGIMGGSVIMETIFQLPGMGRFLVTGMQQRDYPIVQTVVFVISMWIVLVNLAVDVSYGWLDPRVRYD